MNQPLCDGWAATTLGAVSTFVMGQAPPGSASNFDGVGTPFVKAGEFGALRPVIREWTTQPLRRSMTSDVLICVVGATAGKLNLGADCAIGRSVAAVRPSPGIEQKFLYYQLLPMVLELRASSAGSAQGVISSKDLAAIPFVVAPIAEQRRIVAAIEEHLAGLDAAVAGLERARANLRRFIDATIAAAVGPRADWPNVPLRDLGVLKGGLTKGQKRREGDVLRAVPYLRVANVQRGRLDLRDVRNIDATEREIQELRLVPGDVLFNEGGDRDKLGRGWVWNDELAECIHQNHVFRARMNPMIAIPKFVSHFANSHGQRYFLDQGTQTTNLASISMSKLGALPVPVPPLDEQRLIVAEIDEKLTVAERTARDVDAQLARAGKLRQSVLMRAFSGKLVPQDSADEPASELLSRLRETASPTTRVRVDRPRTTRART
jgi:type I restriction enzyme S subunit